MSNLSIHFDMHCHIVIVVVYVLLVSFIQTYRDLFFILHLDWTYLFTPSAHSVIL
jgi:hypothetical protein